MKIGILKALGREDLGDDGLIDDMVLTATIDEILKQFTLNRQHDVPYLAGYSNDGKVIYIDKDLPTSFVDSKGVTHETDRFLILHEVVEKTLIDRLHLKYQFAHQIALRTEKGGVVASGIDWDEYDAFTDKHYKMAYSEAVVNIPKDLDLTPYIDERDFELIEKMKKAMR